MQAAYSEIMRIKQRAARRTGKAAANPTARAGTASSTRTPSAGAGSALGRSGSGTTAQAVQPGGRATAAPAGDPELRAAANYIRSGFYEEAMNTLNGIPTANRTAQWHYYAALDNQGLGNNIRAQEEARTAVSMEPNNYAYQNLLDQLQSPGRSY